MDLVLKLLVSPWFWMDVALSISGGVIVWWGLRVEKKAENLLPPEDFRPDIFGDIVKKQKRELERGWRILMTGIVVEVVAALGVSILSSIEIADLEGKSAVLSERAATNELAAKQLEIQLGETKIGLANAEIHLAQIKSAIPPRQISEKERELFISVLISSNNVSPKIPIKVIVGDTNQEADNFASFIRGMLNDAGYGTNNERIVRIPGFKAINSAVTKDFRTPPIFVILATDNNGEKIPMSMPNLGSVAIWIPTAIAIPSEIENKSQPTSYRYTTNPNDIIFGISSILGHIGFLPTELNRVAILKPGEVAFYVPPQVE